MRNRSRSLRCVLSLALVPVFGPTSALHAQAGTPEPAGLGAVPQWSIGYVVNAPDQMLGVGTMFLGPPLGSWGLYVDAKFSTNDATERLGYDPAMGVDEAEQFGDAYFSDESNWTSVNVGAVRAVTGSFALYAGVGYSREKAYREYFDLARERGESGFYWVDDDGQSGSRVNVFGGALMRVMGNLMFQLGGELAPRGFTVGAAYAFPFRR